MPPELPHERPAPAPGAASPFANWISAAGAILAAGALFSFALLVWMDLTQGDKNPYLGIFTYIVAPVFLILGLALLFFGAWLHRRNQRAGGPRSRLALDLNNPRQRRFLMAFTAGGAAFLLLSAFGSYETYEYSESTQFCGAVCHSAMNPEFTTYQRGAHARVACVDCHVGSGAAWFVKAKLNGAHQLIAFTLDNYHRPIETPIHNLRPAQDTCEKCHWPEKFSGNIERVFRHYLSDRRNTPFSVRMLLHVNQGLPDAPRGGIHWHVLATNRVEYFARDAKRQDIPWMRVTDLSTGKARVFHTDDFKGEPPADEIRVMDCMDCHNRPAHQFPTANDAVEAAMASGAVSRDLPAIKRVAVQALTQKEITTTADAPEKIAAFVRSKFPDPADARRLPRTIEALQAAFAVSIFPERKADWRVYPSNIGHKDWPGCFRCHDDRHKSAGGQTVRSSDCTSCHTIVAQGAVTELGNLSPSGLKFAHPGGELDPDLTCSDCHNGGIQK